MSSFLVTADLDDGQGGLEQFVVEAETPGAAAGLMIAWLDGHVTARAHHGQWIRCARISRQLRAGLSPLGGRGSAPLLPGSYLMDGRKLDGLE